MTDWRRVIVESPFGSPDPAVVAENIRYARACLRDCILRGESPYASHLLLTQAGVLRDDVPEERALGLSAALAWVPASEGSVIYVDRGRTPGMELGIARAHVMGRPVEMRTLPGWKP